MLSVIFILSSAIVLGGCQQAQYSFFGEAKDMISSANAYIEMTKKAALEFNKTFHKLEHALNVFQSKDEVTEYKDCKCYCKCPRPRANVDPRTVEDMKNKILDLRTKLLNVIEEKMASTGEETSNSGYINSYSKFLVIRGICLYADVLISYTLDIMKEERVILSKLTTENSNKRYRRSASHCSCSGDDDTNAQKTFDDLKVKADFVVAKINQFNDKITDITNYFKRMFIVTKRKIKQYFSKRST